ncbi:hypothetical protein [Candidatus Poriferisodalis sp.]|uniref:hypothetical protein n=1 Tax=Candidatus Poriferisodalis sp. TaxID=3101277 RepID=UPI003B02A18D
MTGPLGSLLTASIPTPLVVAWSVLLLLHCTMSHRRLLRRCRRLASEARADAESLRQEFNDYKREIDAEVARMRAELDAYGAWSEANDRFFHHGLVAVSHLLGARALPARRACATVRAATRERRDAAPAWRPRPSRSAGSAATSPPMMRIPRRTCS